MKHKKLKGLSFNCISNRQNKYMKINSALMSATNNSFFLAIFSHF